MNVAIQNIDVSQVADVQSAGGPTMRKKVVVCTKDVEPGDLIYKVSTSRKVPPLALTILHRRKPLPQLLTRIFKARELIAVTVCVPSREIG